MSARFGRSPAVAAAALAAVLAAAWLDRASPVPSAQVSHGSEEAFGRGFHPREVLPLPRGPQRWTKPRARFRFRNLPSGPAALEVRIHGHRSPVAVAANGVVVGHIPQGRFLGRFSLPGPSRGLIEVELRSEGFTSGDGEARGALVDRIRVVPARAAFPPLLLVASLLGPALCTVLSALGAGWGQAMAFGLTALVTSAQCLALYPDGLARSDYSLTLAVLLGTGALLALGFARWTSRRQAGAGRWGFAALFSAWLVQGAAATSPLMVVSDAVFHANNLARVAGGDLFPTSVTQHERPFRFPYGVSFYALLAPLQRAGLDGVWLVRGAAAASAVAASAGLFLLLLPSGAARAGVAAVLLQLLPGTFDVFSYGNLSNVFSQSLTALFFAWWTTSLPGGWPLGSLLLVLGCLGHFSSLVVLAVLCAWLVAARGKALGQRRLVAVAVGLGLSFLYYLQFADLMGSQLPRLMERGGTGPGASWVLSDQAVRALGQWGVPALALALLGRPRLRGGALDRDLLAYWGAGAVLALLAVVTPLEVRYLYALGLPLAAAAAEGTRRLWRAGRGGRAVALCLVCLQAYWAGRNVMESVLHRYRA